MPVREVDQMTNPTAVFGAALSPASFWVPEYLSLSAWIEHAPFAFWLCEALRPRCFVELGAHYGYSYFAFCQAIDRLGLGTAAYAVDNWRGDEHAGFYDESVFTQVAGHNKKYSGFSTLLRMSFDEALDYFPDGGGVDLLHIDGRHFRNDVTHDFDSWRPKLSDHAVVLCHDTNVRERGFGVWDFFAEMAAHYPSFQFVHGHGLGVLAPGSATPLALAPLFAARDDPAAIRAAYAALGQSLTVRVKLAEREREIAALKLGQTPQTVARVTAPREWPEAFDRLYLRPTRPLANGGHGTHANYEDE
jgi:hypothetical protein